MNSKTFTRGLFISAAIAFSMSSLAACTTMDSTAVADNAKNPGSAWSGTIAVIRDPGNIPHVPESGGMSARWSIDEVDMVRYADASCQQQLYDQLPGYLQAMVKEGGWGALSTGVGEGLFSLPFAGTSLVDYGIGGAAVGAVSGMNTGRIRQDQGTAVSLSTCSMELTSMWQNRYHVMQGIALVPWVGNGSTSLPKPVDPANKQPLSFVPMTPTSLGGAAAH